VQGLRESGVVVEGVVGDSDPMVAVQDVWDPRRFDEIVVATLPTGMSRSSRDAHRFRGMSAALLHHVPGLDCVDAASASTSVAASRLP
jgi:hypothetical protein